MYRAGPLLCSRHTSHKHARSLWQYQKGYITQKLWSPGGSAGGKEQKDQPWVCASCLLKKQQSAKKTIMFTGTSVWQRGSVINREYGDHLWYPRSPSLPWCSERLKVHLPDIPAIYFLPEINPFIITKESFLLLMQMSNTRCFHTWLVGKDVGWQKWTVDCHLQLTRADISPFFQLLSIF